MSRYELKLKPTAREGLSAAIGWDPPLATFFAQVLDAAREALDENPVIIWVGTLYGEIEDVDEALRALSPYAVLPPDLRGRLLRDRTEQGARAKQPWVLQA